MKKVSFLLALIVGVFLVFGFAFEEKAVNDNFGKPQLVLDEIVICFSPATTENEKDKLKDLYKMTLKKKSKKPGKFNVYKHQDPASVLENLKKEKGVIYADQNAYGYTFFIPNDPYYSPYQWHMTKIGMEEAWDLSTGSGVVVAIIDTGIKQTLEDLANTSFVTGYDFVNSDNDPTDDDGHGSHVAGTIAQSTNNAVGVTGIAYNASLMPVKVLNQNGSGTYDDIADGIYYAVDNGADIINLSLGGSTSLQILEVAVNYAWNNGVVVVCAAGNSSSSAPFYPAAYTNSISVSATTINDTLASYSNYGSTIDIGAPGGDSGDYNNDGYNDYILQNTFSNTSEGYYFFAGTSMASPHVAGVAALVKSANSSLSNAQIRSILESSALDIGASGWDQYFGHGRVDAYAAVLEAGGGGNISPVANFTYSTVNLQVTFTDQSTDSDGTIVSWSWSFDDGNSSNLQNPVHTYAASGTYSVTLIVTDDAGATDSVTKDVTVTSGGGGITLSATGYKSRGRYFTNLVWTGATGVNVNIYRAGVLITTTANDGSHTDGPLRKGIYTYKVCETDGSACSNEVTITY